MLENIKINPEFERLIPPLTEYEYETLKKDILSAGEIYLPIFVWNGYIVDGHHRFKILTEHQYIKFKIIEKEFANNSDAISWICNNQLGRRNLTPENRKYLIGKRYEIEKSTYGAADRFRGNQYQKVPAGNSHRTRERIAKETGTSDGYVRRAYEFTRGVDAAEELFPGIKEELLSGKIQKNTEEISAISKIPIDARKSISDLLRCRDA